MINIFPYAWRELKRRKARTLADVCGYALAVAMLGTMMHTLTWSKAASSDILDHTGTHFVAFIPVDRTMCPPCAEHWAQTQKTEGFIALGIASGLIPRRFIDKVNALDSVALATGYLQYRFRDPQDQHLFTVGGFHPADSLVIDTTCCAAADIVEGQFITEPDVNHVILEQAYARSRQLKVGDRITIAGCTFDIKGIVNPGIRPAKADIYMLFDDAKQAISKSVQLSLPDDPINMILVEVSSSDVQDQAIRDTKALWRDLVVSSYACYKPASSAASLNTATVACLNIVVAICAIILSAKSQLTSLVERRREIGILKAIGWGNTRIVSQCLVESVIQALVGGCIGCVIAILAVVFIPWDAWFHIRVSTQQLFLPMIFLWGLGLSLIGGMCAGFLPAYLATYKRPSDLLRAI